MGWAIGQSVGAGRPGRAARGAARGVAPSLNVLPGPVPFTRSALTTGAASVRGETAGRYRFIPAARYKRVMIARTASGLTGALALAAALFPPATQAQPGWLRARRPRRPLPPCSPMSASMTGRRPRPRRRAGSIRWRANMSITIG